jgi:hypothetical protein
MGRKGIFKIGFIRANLELLTVGSEALNLNAQGIRVQISAFLFFFPDT